MEQMEARFGSLEGAYRQVADRLNSMDRGIADLRGSMGAEIAELRSGVSAEIAGLRAEMAEQRSEANQRFYRLLSTILASWGTTVLAIVFHH